MYNNDYRNADGPDYLALRMEVPVWVQQKYRRDIIIIIIIIIITRPKPAYGRQGLAGLWGQDTDQGGTFWDVLNVSLRASGAQLGYKLTWNHKKTNLES